MEGTLGDWWNKLVAGPQGQILKGQVFKGSVSHVKEF